MKKAEEKSENFNTIRDHYNSKNQVKHTDSDLFMIKNDKTSFDKSGEKYLFKSINNKYDITTNSNSEWKDKNMYKNFIGYTSIQYDILNPGNKSISKTKEIIYNEANGFNPVNRQKSLCEFIDLNRVGVPNPNKVFLNAANSSKNAFCRNSNICSTFLDMHNKCKDISERPFVKKII